MNNCHVLINYPVFWAFLTLLSFKENQKDCTRKNRKMPLSTKPAFSRNRVTLRVGMSPESL
jgi:hypothetical protein